MEKYRVLIAEDDKMVGRIIQAFFRKLEKWEFNLVENGKLALSCLEKNSYDLILTDIFMPIMDGYTFVKELRRKNILIPVVVMTGEELEKNLFIKFLNEGIKKYIEKPFKREIIDILEEVILEEREKKKQEILSLEIEMDNIKRAQKEAQNSLNKAVSSYKEITTTNYDDIPIPIHHIFKPLSWLGGDFFGVKRSGNKIKIFVADIAGHDAGTSFYAVMLKMMFDDNYDLSGHDFFDTVNIKLLQTSGFERMCTAQFIEIDIKERVVTITNAGHPLSIMIENESDKAEYIELIGSNMLGIFEGAEFKSQVIELGQIARFFFYTDGLLETTLKDNENNRIQLSSKELLKHVETNNKNDLTTAVERIFNEILAISNHKQLDDVLLLGFEL